MLKAWTVKCFVPLVYTVRTQYKQTQRAFIAGFQSQLKQIGFLSVKLNSILQIN